MYSIANVFNWINAVVDVVFIILITLVIVGVPKAADVPSVAVAGILSLFYYIFSLVVGVPLLVYYIFSLAATIIAIIMIRKAKVQGTSKGWHISFLILGLFVNIFLFLGGLFGLIASK